MKNLQGIDLINVWMAMNRLNARKLAKEYGRSDAFVCLFLKRKRASRELVDFLINKGCPEECFKDGRVANHRREKAAA